VRRWTVVSIWKQNRKGVHRTQLLLREAVIVEKDWKSRKFSSSSKCVHSQRCIVATPSSHHLFYLSAICKPCGCCNKSSESLIIFLPSLIVYLRNAVYRSFVYLSAICNPCDCSNKSSESSTIFVPSLIVTARSNGCDLPHRSPLYLCCNAVVTFAATPWLEAIFLARGTLHQCLPTNQHTRRPSSRISLYRPCATSTNYAR
jgi:hypothetical protein